MAEAIPYSVTADVLAKLVSVPFEQLELMYGVKEELKKLERTLSTINAVLLDAEEKQEKSHAAGDWIKRLQDVIYDADDLFDEFAAGKSTRLVRRFFSSSNPIAHHLKMAYKVKLIRQRLDEIAKDISGFNFVQKVVVGMQVKRNSRETDSFVLKSEIIGREESRKKFIEQLLQQPHPREENVSIAAIVGIGGLGKTTLAQVVYNDHEVEKYFEKRMWVCVSEEFDVKVLVKKILKWVTGDGVGDLDLDQLQIRLREKLQGKRYLLVLDDVWNESGESWGHLKKFLLGGAPGSKIVVTTRNIIVASVMGSIILMFYKA